MNLNMAEQIERVWYKRTSVLPDVQGSEASGVSPSIPPPPGKKEKIKNCGILKLHELNTFVQWGWGFEF